MITFMSHGQGSQNKGMGEALLDEFEDKKNKKMNEDFIAIIGLSCKFPGAEDFEEYMSNLEKGINSISPINENRWSINEFYSQEFNTINKSASMWGGQINNFESFDNNFFNISAKEAKNMDPQQRLLMEQTWKCIENSGIAPEQLKNSRTSVYVGFMGTDYHQYIARMDEPIDSYSCLGNYSCILANRLSYYFGFLGESIAIDAACASSLIAIHKARESLRLRNCDYAIVAGVNLNIHPWKYISFSKSHMLSPDGQCKTFDKNADGYVPGDGVGVLLLQRLTGAVEQSNNIYGVIRGSAVNHSGNTISITAPSVERQKEVILAAYKEADVNPDTISYIEAHGTGTSLGDPIEIAGLTHAFRQFTDKKQFCKIGSVKTNIGHLEAAAGIAGVIKILAMMNKEKIFPTLNIKESNPIIDFENSPFIIADELSEWKPLNNESLRAGISSFGMGGANSHLVLESYKKNNAGIAAVEVENEKDNKNKIFLLSAKTEWSLEAIIKKWKLLLKDSAIPEDKINDICLTLLHGRSHFQYRYGIEISNTIELSNALDKHSITASYLFNKDLKLGIGKIQLTGTNDMGKDILQNAIFQKYINQALEELIGITGNKAINSQYQKNQWPKTYLEIFNIITLSAYIMLLKSVGIQSQYFYGEGIGTWVCLIHSGILKLHDVMMLIMDKNKPDNIEIHLAQTPCYIINKEILPIKFTEKDIKNIFMQTEFIDEDFSRLVSKGRLLSESQFTFKKNMEEWNEELNEYGLDVKGIINSNNSEFFDQKIHKEKAILLVLIISSSLRRLNRKWNFEDNNYGNNYLELILELILKEYISKKQIIDILLNKEITSITSITDAINGNIAASSYEALRNVDILTDSLSAYRSEVKKIINKLLNGECESEIYPEKINILIGNFKRILNETEPLSIAAHELFSESFDKILLRLWLAGVNINWFNYFSQKNYEKVPLPTYIFEYKPFLLPSMQKIHKNNPKQNFIGLKSESQRILLKNDQPIIADHIITDQTIVPAASMIEIVANLLNSHFSYIPVSLTNIIIEHPCIVSDNKELLIDIREEQGQFVIKENEINIAKGSFTKPMEKSKPFSVSKFDETNKIDFFNPDHIYLLFKEHGYNYGPSLQVIKKGWVDKEYYYTKLAEKRQIDYTKTILSANLLDGAFQAVLAYHLTNNSDWAANSLYVPFLIKSMVIYDKLNDSCFIRIHKDSIRQTNDSLITNIEIFNEKAELLLFIKEFTLKQVSNNFLTMHSQKQKRNDSSGNSKLKTYSPYWKEKSIDTKQISTGDKISIIINFDENLEDKFSVNMAKVYKKIFNINIQNFLSVKSGSNSQGIDWELFNNQITNTFTFCLLDDKEIDIYFLCKKCNESTNSTNFIDNTAITNLNLQGLFLTVQAFIRTKKNNSLSFLIVTENCMRVSENDSVIGFANGAIVGLAKTVAREFKNIRVKVMDWDNSNGISDQVNPVLECITTDNEEIIAYRENKRFIQCMKEYTLPDFSNKAKVFDSKGVYLLAGGAGGIGKKITEDIIKHCKSNLIIIGKSDNNEERKKWIKELNTSGTNVEYYSVDISNFSELSIAIKEIKKRYKEIKGVIQMSGILEDSLIWNKTIDSFFRVTAPKILGTTNLHFLTESEPLDFFMVFSSIIAITGNIGQSDYAAANSFIDAFAHYRANGNFNGRTICINWTLWTDGGMGRDQNAVKQLGRIGITGIEASDAIDGFWKLINQGNIQSLVLGNDYEDIRKALGINSSLKATKATVRNEVNEIRTGISNVKDFLATTLTEILEIDKSELNEDAEFAEYGMDSIGIMEFVDKISAKFGDTFHHATVMENPSLKKLSAYIENFLGHESPAEFESTTSNKDIGPLFISPTNSPINNKMDIAVIGMAGRFPQSPNVEQFWDNLQNQKCLIDEVLFDRFDINKYYSRNKGEQGKTYSKWGGFIEDIGCFDAQYFKINEEEAINIDPQQRLFLELVQELLDRCGYSKEELNNSKTSVFVGAHESNYGRKIAGRSKYHGPQGIVNVISNLIPGRVMQYYNLRGSAETVYSACSSSLLAIHKACRALISGECNMSIAGGIELLLDEEWFLGFSDAGVLSAEGKCKVFDKNADGFVLGEGLGSVLLKRLDDALRDGDMICGVIKASAINNDGQTMGLTTPNVFAQKEVICEALELGNIDASSITLYEAHGTGTQLGDPIEVKAASQAFREYTAEKQYCAIGSVKSNVGHLLSAAGIVSFIKVLLALKNQQLPPTINCEEVHPRYDFENSPFYPIKKLNYWTPRNSLRRAAISSFGFGGTNCHMIVDEFVNEKYGYTPYRNPKPLTRFNRKHFMLGDIVCSEHEILPFKIFKGVQNKQISAIKAKEILSKWKEYALS
ncbi:MAG TPA: SDR family NAD(P)-dependent oxidoreductase [Methylomusa anaerophila]|uniref:Polyketide synthase PksN n=1 Tax=Methylomusa anaerophila TaxID=1930071 RepID=A0A348AQS8_9FIRM|nr:SDR family NAD(P)-dependent oxidoreductase [Methylomusa anaerophila]BBB93426.1 polyketide synthase PksN [Methylomusa anaerophila]HML90051.1 SDR family NAD(P)-dependent oxidoreductase [Methylomusa anaerophila]